MSISKGDDRVDEFRERYVRELFFKVSVRRHQFEKLVSTIEGLPTHLKSIGEAFLQNLEGTTSTLAIPSSIAIAALNMQRFHQLHMAEIFSAKADMTELGEDTEGADLPEPHKSRALSRAMEAMKQEGESSEKSKSFSMSLVNFLHGTAQNGFANVEKAGRELLRQGLVLMWGAFEVLCRDLFIVHLNKKPREIFKLLNQADTKRRLQLRGIDFETLAENDFGVADRLGSIIAMNQDLSSMIVIKDIFTTLFQHSDSLRKALVEKDLWLLNQRRHLIVHQRAIVDHQYIANTGDSLSIGERLSPTPLEIDNSLHLIRDTGIILLKEIAGSP